MTAERAVRMGVIGVGSLGFHHARILRSLPGARLEGIFDLDTERAQRVERELGVRALGTLPELLALVDAAVVAVPTAMHFAVAQAALARGVHLLIEKPIAATLAEADQIVEAARGAGLLVGTGHVERFNPVLQACEPYLERPRFIESHRLAPFQPRGTDVAVVLDLMIHDLDLVLGLIGEAPESTDAVGIPVLTTNVDIANARLRFPGGAVANLTASRVSAERMRKIRIFQPSGYLSLDLAAGTGEFLRLRADAADALAGGEQPSLGELVERIELRGDGGEPLALELASFVAAVAAGREPLVSAAQGRDALALALDIVARVRGDAKLLAPQLASARA